MTSKRQAENHSTLESEEGAKPGERDDSDSPPASLLEALLGDHGKAARGLGPSSSLTSGESRVARCVDDRHPVLQGRARIRWESRMEPEGEADEDDTEGTWVPVLRGVSVRKGDRLLVLRPDGWEEPVVVGVIDGYRRRAEVPVEGGPTLEMKEDEALTVRSADGTPVVRIRVGSEGPEVQLLSASTRIRLPDDLELSARSLLFRAEEGGVRIEAHDDVVVRGEMIKLN
jgi:hypothetical protein